MLAVPVGPAASLLPRRSRRASRPAAVVDRPGEHQADDRAGGGAAGARRALRGLPPAGGRPPLGVGGIARRGSSPARGSTSAPTAATAPDALGAGAGALGRGWARAPRGGGRGGARPAARLDQPPPPGSASSALAPGAGGRRGAAPASLGPGGRDVTRLAGSSPGMWSSVCLENAGAVEAAVAASRCELAGLREALRARDAAALERLLRRARATGRGERADARGRRRNNPPGRGYRSGVPRPARRASAPQGGASRFLAAGGRRGRRARGVLAGRIFARALRFCSCTPIFVAIHEPACARHRRHGVRREATSSSGSPPRVGE